MTSVNLNNLSIQELKKLVKEKNEEVKKLEQEKEKERLILAYKKLQKKEEKLTQEKKEINKKSKSKSFQDYFQECIKGKYIPEDAPDYFRKALEKAMQEYDNGIKLEKSGLANFAEKYVIDGKPGLIPEEFFGEKKELLEKFFKNHRNVKIRMILVCLMEKKNLLKEK